MCLTHRERVCWGRVRKDRSGAEVAAAKVQTAEQLVAHRVAEQRGIHRVGVADHDRVAFVHHVAVDDASVVRRTGPAPAAGLRSP